MSRDEEFEVIRSGDFHYKGIDIQEASVRFIDTTAILLSRIQMVAVAGGKEVSNPFVVTVVYVQQGDGWTLPTT